MDEAVRALGEGLAPRVALVALGGYGRQCLCPSSDVDLMVLHRERRPERVRQMAESVFYPFWDAGIPLGHAVRTVRECLDAFGERLDAATALIDARLVFGDEQLFADLQRDVGRAVARDPAAFLSRLREGRAERQAVHGSCSRVMEPDLKESIGALRDIHTVGWVRVVNLAGGKTSGPGGDDLLRSPEARALDEAEEFMVRLRSALHLETGRRSDRLFFEHQPFIAETFGFEPTARIGAADALMRGLFQHARQVEHVTESILHRAEVRGAGGGHLESVAPSNSDELMQAFARAAEEGKPFDPVSQDSIDKADVGEIPYPWTDETRRSFLELLASGDRGERALEAMDRMDLLSRFLPEWEPVRCRPQRDPYHQFTVDVHLMRTAAEAARLLSTAGGGDPVARQAVAGVEDRNALLLGALLHDIGKTGEGPHVDVGVHIARRVLERMGVSGPTLDHVLFLIGHHLLLSDTATRRDLSDENLVLDVAAAIGDPHRLAMLYVLTAADAMSTGPHAWTPWRQTLIKELVGKVEHVLERGEMSTDAAGRLQTQIAALREFLQEEDEAVVNTYVERLPRAYLLAVPPKVAAQHFRLAAPSIGAAEVRTEARPGERTGTHDLTVVAADRPGLLAKVAGALALNGLNILSARAFTTEDGVAIDLFVVEPVFDEEVEEERWRRFRMDLRKALEGRISLEYRVREKRRHYPRPHGDIPISVSVDNHASNFFTVVEVSAPDRIGLLFDVARAFHELELDVHVAKVATYGSRVVDAFYVRDLFGAKMEDPEHINETERAILARLTDEG